VSQQRDHDRGRFTDAERQLSQLVADKTRRVEALQRTAADLDAKLAAATAAQQPANTFDDAKIQLRFAQERHEADTAHFRSEMTAMLETFNTKEKHLLSQIADLQRQNAMLRSVHDTSLSELDTKLSSEVLTLRKRIETKDVDHSTEVTRLSHELDEQRRHVRRLQQHQSECAATEELRRVSEAIRVKSQAEEKVREATRLLVAQLEQERRSRSALQDENLVLKLRLEEFQSKFEFLEEKVAPAVEASVAVLEEQAHEKRRVARQYRQLALEGQTHAPSQQHNPILAGSSSGGGAAVNPDTSSAAVLSGVSRGGNVAHAYSVFTSSSSRSVTATGGNIRDIAAGETGRHSSSLSSVLAGTALFRGDSTSNGADTSLTLSPPPRSLTRD
jgi:hypothetical protein